VADFIHVLVGFIFSTNSVSRLKFPFRFSLYVAGEQSQVKFLSNDTAMYFTDSNPVRTASQNKHRYIVKQYNVLHVSASRVIFSYLYKHWKKLDGWGM